MKKLLSLLLITLFLINCGITALAFKDVKADAWYSDAVEYCVYKGLISGMSADVFSPNSTLTRAQFVTMLAKLDKAELDSYKGISSGFDDVAKGSWYHGAVAWAHSEGYVSGVTKKSFAPNAFVTRQQLARMLYVYAADKGLDMNVIVSLNSFSDTNKVSLWAYEPMQWAVANKIISGVGNARLAPTATATRAQAVQMMMLFSQLLNSELPGQWKHNPVLTIDGLKVTVSGITDVDVIRASMGTYDNTHDIKNDPTCVNYNQCAFKHQDSYTITMPMAGDITISVLYDDGTLYIFNETVEGEPAGPKEHNPELTIEGRDITVTNLEDVYVIRAVMGTYTENHWLRIAPGCVNYSQSLIKQAPTYTFAMPEEGACSVAVQYQDGAIYIFNVSVSGNSKIDPYHYPEYTLDGTDITFTGLEDVKVIRVAKGTITDAASIKAAEDCINYVASTIGNSGSFTFSVPKAGEYSVAVQYTSNKIYIFNIVV